MAVSSLNTCVCVCVRDFRGCKVGSHVARRRRLITMIFMMRVGIPTARRVIFNRLEHHDLAMTSLLLLQLQALGP